MSINFFRQYTHSFLGACTLLLFSVSMFASEAKSEQESPVVLNAYQKVSFNPSREEKFTFPITVETPQNLKKIIVEIRTHDDDVIRRLELDRFEKDKEEYQLVWDGKDSQKQIVPNEAYYPIVIVTDKQDKTSTLDSRTNSGGEEVYDFEKNITPKTIEYTLPVASRVLIRSGIKNGPMLRTIIDWEPRAAGFYAERWNGRDADDVMTISQNPQVGYLIIGYQLPDHTIITYGNTKENYRTYRERKKWPIKKANYENRLLERGDKLIRSEFYTPVLQQKSPRIDARLVDKKTRKPTSTIKDFDEVLTEVKLNALDEIYLDQERYEITFFVDNEFIAEEEQGFVPFTWRWSPGRYGIKPGEHILTVNISGYNGQVGVKNIPFTLVADEKLNQ